MTFVPQAVRRFSQAYPDVGLSPSELAVDAQVERLRSDRLDVAILRLPARTDGLALASIADEGLVVAAPDSHPLAGRERISPAAIAQEPLILLAREIVPGLYDQIIALQHQHGTAWIAQEATSIQAVLGLVAAGLGISLLPASVRTLARSGITFVTLSPSPRSEIQLAWRESDRSPLTAAFVEAAHARAHPT